MEIERPLANIQDLSCSIIKENKTWSTLLDAVDATFAAHIDFPLNQLSNLRQFTAETDVNLLEATIRMLGLDVDQDVMDMNHGKMTRLLTQLAQYPDYSSTNFFVNFLDIVLNGKCTVIPLYTIDYVEFVPGIEKEDWVTYDGEWYLTTWVDIELVVFNKGDNSIFTNADPTYTKSKLLEVIYQFSPVSMVVRNFSVVQDVAHD